MYLMWENSSLLSKKLCSVLDVKSHLSHQHALNQLETAVLDSTHTMHKRLRQDEVGLALNALFRDWCSLDLDMVVW